MSKKTVAIVAVLVLLLAGASVFGFLMWKSKEKAEEMAPAPISFVVNAEGWSDETSSPIPIQVTGETADKEKVDVKYFLGASDKDLSLKPGTYDVEVYASPVNADGGMYRCPKASKITVPKNTDKKQNVSKSEKTGEPEAQPSASAFASASSEPVVSAEFELAPVPANEITDEDIEKAQSAMKDAGLDEAKIKAFTDSARKARQTELDRITAKEEAERIAKEREAQGMYPGAGGARPANARLITTYLDDLWIINSPYAHCSSTSDAELRNTGGVLCVVLGWMDVSPAGEAYYEGPFSPSGIYPVDSVRFDSDGNASLEVSHPTGVGTGDEPKVGEAWYYGDHVFGVTSSGLTYWNSRTGKGAFMSPNAYIPF